MLGTTDDSRDKMCDTGGMMINKMIKGSFNTIRLAKNKKS